MEKAADHVLLFPLLTASTDGRRYVSDSLRGRKAYCHNFTVEECQTQPHFLPCQVSKRQGEEYGREKRR